MYFHLVHQRIGQSFESASILVNESERDDASSRNSNDEATGRSVQGLAPGCQVCSPLSMESSNEWPVTDRVIDSSRPVLRLIHPLPSGRTFPKMMNVALVVHVDLPDDLGPKTDS